MEINVLKIDPEKAAEFLARNRKNRALRWRHVRSLASDMSTGNWKLNGETIKFAADGTLLDGQHRLAAVVESGVAVEMLVVTGLSGLDQETMDTGAKRTLSDVLALRGEENSSHLAAAIVMRWRRQHGQIFNNISPTNAQAVAMLETHPELRYSISAVRPAVRALRIPWGLCAALHYDMTLINPEDAADFWTKLATGLGVHEKHPVYILRRRLEENAAMTGRKLDRIMIHAYLIKTWNAYREGRDVSIIRWIRGGASPEAFPELV